MALVRFDEVGLAFGEQIILREASLLIEPNERLCLIGRNGAGKSSTFKLIAQQIEPDSGFIEWRSDLVVSQLEQNLPKAAGVTVRDTVKSALSHIESLVDEYNQLSKTTMDKKGLRDLEALQQRIDALDGWRLPQRVDEIMSQLKLPADRTMDSLSGGWRRRVALAKALVTKPNLLLLDEPTNHLDITTIEWLEKQVRNFVGSVLFITHDRTFLQKIATRIIELDRGNLVSWPGNYKDYLRRKQQAIVEEERQNKLFDKRLGQEEDWIRQGIKARRTRNEGRVRALEDMREEASQRIKREKSARIHIEEAERSGRKVLEARNLTFAYPGEDPIVDKFSIKLMRGDRIGLVGNNGVGKSTLLRLLLGQLEPQSGVLKQGTNLEIGYFDQLRQALDLEKSVAYNVGDGQEYIKINGKDRHVVGYLTGFLFTAKRALTPVKALSGGERNRVILARLFTQAANLLVLDEPTNDLDVETLQVLEDRLREYQGTLIVVSHDREFLNNVVNSILVFESSGEIEHYMGGYDSWAKRGRALAVQDDIAREQYKKQNQVKVESKKPNKLSYKEQRALEVLPKTIEGLEAEISSLQAQIADPSFYQKAYALTQPVLDELAEKTVALDEATQAWLELEELSEAYQKSRS